MILAITDKCSMGCNHCMSDCSSNLAHTTLEQFKRNLEWCLHPKLNFHPIIISGGEPFEHPDIKEILEYTANRYNKYKKNVAIPKPMLIATNGSCLVDDKELYSWYKDFTKKNPWILTQLTNVKEYYPRVFTDKEKYWLSKIHGCTVCDSIKDVPLYPQGRALNLENPNYETKAPKCANIRLLSMQLPELSAFDLFNMIAMKLHKFCEPRVNIDGSISIGESRLCPSIGTIDDTEDTILEAVRGFKCAACKISIEKLKNDNPLVYELFNMKQ